jgi:phosphate/phosphite/phosphonate ABC transporter binding protein
MHRLRKLLLLLSGLLAATAGPAAADDAPLVLGSYAYPTLDRTRALAPLAGVIESAAGQPVEIRLYADPDALARAIAAGEVDVAVLNLGAWLRAAHTPGILPLAVLVPAPDVRERYRAVLLAAPAAGAADLAAAARIASGKRLAAVLPGSTSGGLVQLAALAEAASGKAPALTVSYAGSHEAAVMALVKGEADFAAVAETPWVSWQAANPDRPDKPRAIWRSEPLPPGPVVCRPSSRLDCAGLEAALLGTDEATLDAARGVAAGWPELAGSDRFFAYDAASYAALIAAAAPAP